MPHDTDDEQAGDRGERIAKVIARIGVCSRREAEQRIAEGRVSVNGRPISSPATLISEADTVCIDGVVLPEKPRARLWRYHKPPGLLTTHNDPQGRPTVFDRLPAALGRVISVGRLDLASEGLLLLTNDGTLARRLELPATGWTRRYKVRAYGFVDESALAGLQAGVTVAGIHYAPIEARLERTQGSNVWLTMALQEGKNREIRKVLEALGLQVNRLIRLAFGPFQLGNLPRGEITEISPKVLREQLGKGIFG